MSGSPPDIDSFTRKLDSLGVPARFAIAVSGGRDSMALAFLAAGYAARSNIPCTALIVDHGLREGSAEVASRCADRCSALGLRVRILSRDARKPLTAIQDAARRMRYRLLADACYDLGVNALLTAHSGDDQAETFLMRLRRGSGVSGLSAMPDGIGIASGAGNSIRLFRPFLDISRKQLTRMLEDAGQEYDDDPANDDPAYERVRIRALLAALDEQDLLAWPALVRSARRLSVASGRLRREEAGLFSALGGCFHGWGGISLDSIPCGETMDSLAVRLVHAVSGSDYCPDSGRGTAVLDQVRACGAATLSGALIKYEKNRYWFMREPSAVLGRHGVVPQEPVRIDSSVLWDGRFIITPPAGDTLFSVRPAGKVPDILDESRILFTGPREGLCTVPALYAGQNPVAIAGIRTGGLSVACFTSLAEERFEGKVIRFQAEGR